MKSYPVKNVPCTIFPNVIITMHSTHKLIFEAIVNDVLKLTTVRLSN